MNVIASLLRGLSPQPPVEGVQQREKDSEAQAGAGTGFDSVLSGLSQNSSAGADGATSPAPQKPGGLRMTAEETQAEVADGSATAGQSNSTTIAQTLAALGDLANLSEADAGNAAAQSKFPAGAQTFLRGDTASLPGDNPDNASGTSPKLPNGNAKASGSGNPQPKGFLANLGAAGEASIGATNDTTTGQGTSQNAAAPDPKTSVLAAEVLAANQTLPDGAANPQAAVGGTVAQTPAPVSTTTFNKAATKSMQASGDTQPPPDPDAADAAASSLLASGIAAEVDQSAPPSGSSQPSSSKDPNPSSSSATSPNLATTLLAANAAAMASLQPLAPPAPNVTGAGSTAARAETEKSGAKSASAVRQAASGRDANSDASSDSAAQTVSIANIAFDSAINVNAPAPQQPIVPAVHASAAPIVPMQTGAAAAANMSSTLAPLSQLSAAPSDAAAAGDIKIAVLSTATHFAPPARLSPIQQIATAVAGALPGLSPAAPGPASASLSATSDSAATGGAAGVASDSANLSQSAAGPVKVLNLQLEPPNLGTVTVSLNLSDGGLNVQMAASQSTTANLIDRDKNSLTDQLRDSGYSVAGVAVTLDTHAANVGADGSATQGQAGQSFTQNNGQEMSQGGSSNGNGSTGQNAGERSRPEPLAPISDGLAGVVSGGSPSGELYI